MYFLFLVMIKNNSNKKKCFYWSITITYKILKMSDTDSTEMNNLLDNLKQKIKDLENENNSLKIENEDLKTRNKNLDETNEFLIDRNEYLLDKNEYLKDINTKNEYLEFKIKDLVDLEIENEAWRNGYDELIKQYDSDFSLTYLKNRNAELENKVKLLEEIANQDLVKQNKLLENKIRILEIPKDPPKPAPAHRKETKKDNKTPVFVKPFIRDWVKYYRSADNILYDKYGYPEGKWDNVAKKIITFSEQEIGRSRRPQKLQILL